MIKAVKRGATLTRSVARGLWSDEGSLGQKAVRGEGTSRGTVAHGQAAVPESLECWLWPLLLWRLAGPCWRPS